MKQQYTVRDVLKQLHPTLINEEIPFEPSEPGYLPNYQRAVTTVLKNMDDGELEKLENIAEEWNKKGVPADVQLK